MSRVTRLSFLLVSVALVGATPETLVKDKQSLSGFQAYVGEWKGVGQVKRGSSQGAWLETWQWAWQFDGERAALVGKSENAKYFSELKLQPGAKAGEFTLLAAPIEAGAAPRKFAGKLDDSGQLVLEGEKSEPNAPARISIRTVAGGDRLLVLYEQQLSKDQYGRLAEVGATRKGSAFGKGQYFPECVVTGGHAVMSVDYKGKKYPLCCTGCRDMFNEDPEGVLAEYAAKVKEREKKGKE